MSNDGKKYQIIKDRVEIFKDFTLSLLYYIQKYYLDKDSLSKDQDIYNHYSWCFKKVCNEFLLEEIMAEHRKRNRSDKTRSPKSLDRARGNPGHRRRSGYATI